MSVAFKQLTDICASMMTGIEKFSEQLGMKSEATKLGEFIQMIYRVFHMKHQASLKYDSIQSEAAYNEVRLTLMKLSLMFDNLPPSCRAFINSHL